MNSSDNRTPYILGLDLGVASIGWARVACDPNSTGERFKPVGLLGAGAHLFEGGTEGTMADIEKGKDQARNVQRRTARLMRRQTWRRARRKRVLLRRLIDLDLLPAPSSLGLTIGESLRRPLDIDAYIKEFDRRLAARWAALRGTTGADAHADQQRLCYLLREAAARGPVERHELGRALYHLAQRRGFQSNRRAEAGKKEDEDLGTVKKAIGELGEKIAAFAAAGGVPTLGAYLASLDPDEQRLRGRWTARKMYLDEFDRVWSGQAERMRLDETARKEVHEAIFHQRPLKDQSNLIGRCSLIPSEKRCPIAHRAYQRFRLLQSVNHLSVAEPAAVTRPLTAEEREALISALSMQGDLSFDKVRRLLGLKRGTNFNLERGDEKRIIGNRTDARLREVFGERFDGFTDAEKDRMVEDLRSFRLPEALVRRGVRRWGLSPDAAAAFAAIGLEEGYAPISLAAVRVLLPRMEEGLPYATARKDEFPDSFKSAEPLPELPPVLKAMDDLRNPAVLRTLTEARKLINEMIRRHGRPAVIRVELAREIKNPRNVRERLTRTMRDREKERAAVIARIQKEAGIAAPRRDDVEKVLLADECGWVCPYTGRQIGWDTLLGPHPQFDVEHIWPRSRSLDDSFRNKTLCHHEENRSRKRGQTPREAYGGSPERLGEIIGRMRLWKGDPFVKAEKIARFEAEQIPEGFSNRDLSDTRFIARAAADYLGLLYGGRVEAAAGEGPGTRRVEVCTGGLTAWLRSGWGIDGLLGDSAEKNRADHRHHAVDAIIVALSDARAVRTLARAATEADRLGKRRAFDTIEEPWAGFREEAKRMIDAVVVSHRQSRKVSGPLHDQSIYSRPIGPEKVHRIRKELHKLTVSEIRDGKVVDKRAMAALRALVLEKLGTDSPTPQNLTKLLSDPANAPLMKGADGKMVRLRKVRVESDAGRRIGRDDKATGRWVNPSNNHHTVIVEVRDAKGRVRWEDRPVQLIDAYARQAAKVPIVDRHVGEGEYFVCSLAPGEFVEMNTPGDATKRAIYRIASISEGDNELKLHRDGRTADQLKKDKARVRVSGEKLRLLQARKVRITYLGEVRNAGG
ncbi:MAG: type II CRISPR RNA-guided endonuclease Cas9 [Phycisphaerales bacterium]